jgi:hypothetical protein
MPTAVFKVNWKGLFLYGPDMSCALAGIGGLSALTGLLRVIKAGHPVRSRPPGRQMPAATRLRLRRRSRAGGRPRREVGCDGRHTHGWAFTARR